MKDLFYRTNIIILSDHGMEECRLKDSVNLYKYVRRDSCEMYGSSPVLQIVPTTPDLNDEIYANLSKAAKENGKFDVYLDSELPERWNIKNTDRFGPITAVAKKNGSFQDLVSLAEWFKHEYGFECKQNQLKSLILFSFNLLSNF